MPGFGESIFIGEDQLPVFWVCGATLQVVTMSARPPFMIIHSPGHIFVTDRPNVKYEACADAQPVLSNGPIYLDGIGCYFGTRFRTK